MNTDTTALERRIAALETDLAELAYSLMDRLSGALADDHLDEHCWGIVHRLNDEAHLAVQEEPPCRCHGCRWREGAA